MARSRAPVDINGFEGGLVTDLSPLDQAPNTTSDESNMDLNSDKSRSRRFGISLESADNIVDSGVATQSVFPMGSSVFTWKNAGGDVNKELFVVQVGTNLKIFDLDNVVITSEVIYTEDFETDYSTVFSYAVVDGILTIGTGLKEIVSYTYDSGTITKSVSKLLIRDLFGVESYGDSVELTDPQNFQVRPSSLEDTHLYNLRNGTFTIPRYNNDEANGAPAHVFLDGLQQILEENPASELADDRLTDPLRSFRVLSNTFPSNSDNLLEYLYPDANDSSNRTIERFFPIDMRDTQATSSASPKGFFIIDALDRGSSRIAQEQLLQDNNPNLYYSVSSLPLDQTTSGAKVITEHSGRVWYAGFPADLIDGDKKSPRMSSYILFSRLVRDTSDIGRCYQDADPTSSIDNTIVDTDGGFIRIDEAYDIKSMVSVSKSLLIFAKNGVWSVQGGDSDGFKATDYAVKKITSNGIDATKSVVVVDDSVLYWGEESIYLLNIDQVSGEYSSKDITTTVIKDYYLNIDIAKRKTCSGYFDKYDRKVYWAYSDNFGEDSYTEQLIYNIDFSSFTKYKINTYENNLPKIVDLGESQPYPSRSVDTIVSVGGETVVVGADIVTSSEVTRLSSSKDVIHLVFTSSAPTIQYGLARFVNNSFEDWDHLGGVDSGAYMTLNPISGGARNEKQVPYLTTMFKSTETGVDTNYDLIGQSSCLISSRWGWTDSDNSNKWSTPRQAYRIRRPYFANVGDFDNGESVLITRNKIRGSGKSVSFHLESEAGKDMHIHGWSFDLDRTGQE